MNIEEQTLLDRCEDYPEGADLPEGVLCLTMGVDCQKRYLQWEVVGWSRYWESWGISTGMIPGSPDDPKTWRQLDAVISRKFKFPNGKALYISLTFIDSGDGKFTNEIAAYCHARESRNVFAIKGSSSFDKPFINAPSHIPVAADSNQKYWLYNIGVSSGKSIIYSALTIKDKGPNYMHFPRDESRGYNLNYFTQLISETLTREGKMLKWTLRPGHERNEALDIRNYARAAIQVLNPNFDAIERALKREPSEKKAKKAPKPKPKRSSRADEFFD